MPEPTLQQVFGASATQTATTITITKADFVSIGLTPSATNTSEALYVALLLFAANNLTEANRLTDLVARNVAIDYSGQDLVNQGGSNVFLRDSYQVSLYKATTIAAIDPDNY
jgi:hypothetical protein